MAEYSWPDFEKRNLIGQRISRLDGPVKVSGRATYSYDVQRPGLLHGAVLRCPHAHARITKLDVSPARSMKGVKAVRVIQDVGAEVQWALDEIVFLAAETELIARDAVRAIVVEYEVLPHFVSEEAKENAPEVKPAQEEVVGDPDAGFAAAAAKSDNTYGIPVISHCCLEAHGQVCEWDGENLTAWCSTQGVSVIPGQFAEGLKIPAANVRVVTPYMGGGFGSKFSVDRWGIECAELAREAGAPVKLMLERDAELTVAGDRPSAFARIQVACDKEGNVLAWSSESWGSGGLAGSGSPPLPYVFQFPNRRHQHSSVPTHTASSRAWRAPNHPQACFLTMAALEDAAAEIGMDPLDLFRKNLHVAGRLAAVYDQELSVAEKMMDWKERWHPRGKGAASGSVKRGLGLSLHTWGGRGHQSNCQVVVYPDGLVEAKIGSQDLGTGTRTVIGIVLADAFGLPLSAVKVSMGDSMYPPSGPSGGSTTVGGVSSSTRRAATDALAQVFAKVAPELGVEPDKLEARNGRIQVADDPGKFLEWKQAAAAIGVNPITVMGRNPGPGTLTNSGVGGVQMADVSVDVETGVVKIEKLVAVQDCGLIIDLKTAETQVYGAMCMGVAYALMEEKVMDPVSGRMLNADMEFYKLPGILDVGEMEVHMMTGPGYDDRGVIGLGEPPVISPGAAIANAVANAIGVRVTHLPMTPDRVLGALEKGGMA